MLHQRQFIGTIMQRAVYYKLLDVVGGLPSVKNRIQNLH